MKLIVKQILCIKLVKYWDKYTEMQHGQQNVNKKKTAESRNFLRELFLGMSLSKFSLSLLSETSEHVSAYTRNSYKTSSSFRTLPLQAMMAAEVQETREACCILIVLIVEESGHSCSLVTGDPNFKLAITLQEQVSQTNRPLHVQDVM